jgi:hypothetical protein
MPSNRRPPWTPHPPDKAYLLRRYGITWEDWWAIFKAQGGGCAVCGNTARRLHVDHDHRAEGRKPGQVWSKKGSVRGLTCWVHNVALQAFRDQAAHMRAGAEYIESPPAWRLWPDEKRGVPGGEGGSDERIT